MMACLTALTLSGPYTGVEQFSVVVNATDLARVVADHLSRFLPLTVEWNTEETAVITVDVHRAEGDPESASGLVLVNIMRWAMVGDLRDKPILAGVHQCYAQVSTSRPMWERSRNKAVEQCLDEVIEHILGYAENMKEA